MRLLHFETGFMKGEAQMKFCKVPINFLNKLKHSFELEFKVPLQNYYLNLTQFQ